MGLFIVAHCSGATPSLKIEKQMKNCNENIELNSDAIGMTDSELSTNIPIDDEKSELAQDSAITRIKNLVATKNMQAARISIFDTFSNLNKFADAFSLVHVGHD
jgi:hypothetical protein